MSDPIRSISQNNYLLQVAADSSVSTSTGIVGDGTPENPLRLDETVLFESTNGVDGNNLPSNMEDMHNFEYIRIVLAGNSTLTNSYDKRAITYDSSTNYFLMVFPSQSGYMGYIALKNNGTSIGFKNSYNSAGFDKKGEMRLYKVVGINRIANS